MPPKSRICSGGRGVARVVGQLRVEHALDRRVADEQVDHGPGVGAVAVHAHGQRLQAPQHEVAVERRGHRARGVLGEAEPLGQLVVVHGDEAADDVGVAAEVLRGRVHDDVGPQAERLLQVGVAKVLSTTTSAPRSWASAATASMSMQVSSGLVGVSSQTMRVSGASRPRSASRSVRSTAVHG